ncbi:MAG: hypothetical protein JSR21_13905 [Proteobacteria bacterium]|nr:hypothetical protein [Pseudomonadota bacterium]
MLQLTGALDALLGIGVALACIIAERAIAKFDATDRASPMPSARDEAPRMAGFWGRIAVLMKRTALLCNWLEEGNLPPRLGSPPPAPSSRPAAAAAGRERAQGSDGSDGSAVRGSDTGARGGGADGAPGEGRRRDGDAWYARLRAEFARRPIEEFLARLHRTLSEAVRRADRPDAMGRIEELLARVRRLLAAMPKMRAAATPAMERAGEQDARCAAGIPPAPGGAAFCA